MKPVPRAADFMEKKPLIFPPDMPVREAARRLLETEAAGAPVVDSEGRLLGVFSQQGLMICLVNVVDSGVFPGSLEHHLDPDPPRIAEETSLLTVAKIFAESDHTHCILPVMKGEKFVGVVTRLDVMRAYLDYISEAKDTRSRLLYLSALQSPDEAPPTF